MGKHKDSLTRAFDGAGLLAEVFKQAFVRGVRGPVFQMDIRNRNRQDYFRIFPSDAEVFVENADKKIGQLVLFCKEPERKFVERRYMGKTTSVRQTVVNAMGPNEKILSRDGLYAWVERKTPAEKRHFLMGHDERPVEYFIAQLPHGVSTVRQAHEILKAPEVRGVNGKVLRQGEFFFLEITQEEEAAIAKALTNNLSLVGHKVPIGAAVFGGNIVKRQWGGNPHVADEIVILEKDGEGETVRDHLRRQTRVIRPHEVFVRGKIRHTEHDTLNLRAWRKVVINQEKREANGIAAMRGIGWVD